MGVFRALADGTLVAEDDAVRAILTPPAVTELFALASPGKLVDVPLGGALVRVRRDGDALVGLVVSSVATRSVTPTHVRELELLSILERSLEGIVLHRDGAVVYANTRAAAIFGADDPRALEGTALRAELRDERAGAEVRIVAQDGSERLLEVVRSELTYEGRATQLLLLNDLTDRRILQAKLTQSDRLATIGMLAASIAHEVNNPLTYVMHYVERLEREIEELLPQEASARALQLAQGARAAVEGCNRVRDIVRDLKTFSRVEDGISVPIDVNRALRSALQMAGHQIRARARLTVGLGALPAVRAHDGRLCQVFLNLLLNAAQAIDRAADKREQCVEVRSWTEAGFVHVAIRDTGGGIDPEQLPRLFEPFFTTKPHGVGTGLGLWICREIVQEIGGEIRVSSTPREGTEITVVLPVAAGGMIHVSSVPPEPDSKTLFVGNLRRILVVEDEPALRELLAETLGEHADVTTASSGCEARELLEHDPEFDAILCDVMMPGMSGADLHAWVDRTYPALAPRMIFMTGASHSAGVREFLAGVGNECLDKPFRVRDVERVLDRVIDSALRVHA